MTDKIAEQMARLEERQEWALHVARAGLVKCVEREESKRGMRWTVPSRTRARGMEFHDVRRVKGNQFKCWLVNPLGWGDPCKGNRVAEAGACRHVIAVVTDEMLRRGISVKFVLSERAAKKGKRGAFRVYGENGGELWVSHRKERR